MRAAVSAAVAAMGAALFGDSDRVPSRWFTPRGYRRPAELDAEALRLAQVKRERKADKRARDWMTSALCQDPVHQRNRRRA